MDPNLPDEKMLLTMMIKIVEDNHDDQPIIKSSPDVGLLWKCRPPCNVFIAQQLHQSLIMIMIIIVIIIAMACRHIPTMTKSHHGGNMSAMK